jgi:hypothetical protein
MAGMLCYDGARPLSHGAARCCICCDALLRAAAMPASSFAIAMIKASHHLGCRRACPERGIFCAFARRRARPAPRASCVLASPRHEGEGNSQFSRAHMNPPRCTRSTSHAQTQYRRRLLLIPDHAPSVSCRISQPSAAHQATRCDQGPGCRNCLLLKTAPPCPGMRRFCKSPDLHLTQPSWEIISAHASNQSDRCLGDPYRPNQAQLPRRRRPNYLR